MSVVMRLTKRQQQLVQISCTEYHPIQKNKWKCQVEITLRP